MADYKYSQSSRQWASSSIVPSSINNEKSRSPVQLLNISSVVDVLNQALGKGIRSAVLLNMQGKCVICAGGSEEQFNIMAAVLSGIVAHCKHQAYSLLSGEQLRIGLIDFEEVRLCYTDVASMVLCVISDVDVSVDFLMARTRTIKHFLQEPLMHITMPS